MDKKRRGQFENNLIHVLPVDRVLAAYISRGRRSLTFRREICGSLVSGERSRRWDGKVKREAKKTRALNDAYNNLFRDDKRSPIIVFMCSQGY